MLKVVEESLFMYMYHMPPQGSDPGVVELTCTFAFRHRVAGINLL